LPGPEHTAARHACRSSKKRPATAAPHPNKLLNYQLLK
jgi:hypothetical protein